MAIGVRSVAADASQAAYFRGFLADERELVVGGLAQSRVRLWQCVDGAQVVGLRVMARRRFEVRELETELWDLNRLIAARSTVLGVVGARGLKAHSDQLLLSAALDEERFVVGIGLPSNRA